MRPTRTILIVDDEVGGRKTLERLLSNVLAAQPTAAHFLDMSQWRLITIKRRDLL